MLINRQGFTPSMARDQLKLGICQPGVPSQPSNTLVPERVRRGRDASLFRIHFDDLLDAPRRVFGVAAGLKQPPVVGVGGDVCSQCRAERLAEQNESVLVALPGIDADLVVLKVDVADLDATEFADTHCRLEQKSEHQCVLHIIGTVHSLIKAAEICCTENFGKSSALLSRSQ